MRQRVEGNHGIQIDLGGGIVREIIYIPEESRFVERVFDSSEEMKLQIMKEIEAISQETEKELRKELESAVAPKTTLWGKIKAWIRKAKK